jgi:hypothetical protein
MEPLEETAAAEEEAQFFPKLVEPVHRETTAELETSITVEEEVDRALLVQEETIALARLVEQEVPVPFFPLLDGFLLKQPLAVAVAVVAVDKEEALSVVQA